MKFRPNIAEGDRKTKMNKIIKFIEKKHRIKVSMQFKGREIDLKDFGLQKMNKVIEEAVEAGAIVSSPLKFKGNMAMAILDTKKK